VRREVAVQGAAVELELTGDLLERASARRKEQLDQFPDSVQRGQVLGGGQRSEELLRVGPQVRCRRRRAAFAREVISRTGPAGRERAKNLLWAAAVNASGGGRSR